MVEPFIFEFEDIINSANIIEEKLKFLVKKNQFEKYQYEISEIYQKIDNIKNNAIFLKKELL